MSRRPNPARIYEAQRAGAIARLATRTGTERAEARIGEGSQARLLVTLTTVRVEQR